MTSNSYSRKLHIVTLIWIMFSLQLSGQIDAGGNITLLKEGNFRLYPSDVTQSEVFIVNSPVNPDVLFSSCNTLSFIPFFISEGIYVTENSGITWQGSDTCAGEPIMFHGGDPGIAIDKNGTFILTRLGQSPFSGLYSHYSNDTGKTWSSQLTISTDDLERADVASDVIGGSMYSGRTYAAWVKFALPFPMMFAYTDDITQSWSSPQQINNPLNRSAGGDLAVGPNGEIYACWAGVSETSPFREILVGFATSVNGGEDWNVTENVFPMNGITGVLTNKGNIRVNGLPEMAIDTTSGQRKGWIYIVTGQKDLPPAGNDPDIILYRSADDGATWSSGIRVNQDALNNGNTQYFPSIHVDQYGAVNILFYDDRNTTIDSTGVFLARSKDGGDSWTEFEISDHNYKPAPIGGLGQGYQGDNIGVTSNDSTLWPVWMDNSTGIYQIWTAPLDFSSISTQEEYRKTSSGLTLKQNVPNPFYSSTSIGYKIIKKGPVSLKVFDVMGNEIAELVNKIQWPGYYEVDFDPSVYFHRKNIRNGLYFYRLSMNEESESKRMVFIK